MAEAAGKSEGAGGLFGRLPAMYMLAVFFLMVYAMFIGFKMSGILSGGGEVPPLLEAAHSHTLLIGVLLLFPVFDLRSRALEGRERISGRALEMVLGISIAGLALLALGFSIAGLYPAMAKAGMYIAHAGQITAFLAFFAYAIADVLEEAYR